MPTAKFVKLLEADGLEFKAKNRQVAVSQALGTKGDDFTFVTDRKIGWLLSPHKGENPTDVAAGNSDGRVFNVQSAS